MNIQDLLNSMKECIAELVDAFADFAQLVEEYNRLSLSDTAKEFIRKKHIYKKKHNNKHKIISENITVMQDNITERVRGPPQAVPKLISSKMVQQ